jgi:DNA-binding response OmpR family regulator
MNILLFTKEEILLTTLEYRFRKQSWSLTVAEDYYKAKEKIKKRPPDLVIVDLQLPEFHGLDIVQFLQKEMSEKLPILVIASLEDENLILESLRLGAADFILAPYKPDELILRIRRLLQTRNLVD